MEVSKIFDRYKLKIADNTIYDFVRERYVHLTPEEIVRQKTLKFLMNRLGIPKDRIIVERSLGTLGVKGSKKRIDIGVYDDEGLLMAVVECKAPAVFNPEAAFTQAQNYLRELNTRYFFVTDGCSFEGFYYDTIKDIKLKEIPKYDLWYYYPTE